MSTCECKMIHAAWQDKKNYKMSRFGGGVGAGDTEPEPRIKKCFYFFKFK